MPIVAKKTGANFTPAPSGTHPAVCVDVIDLGMLTVTYANQPPKKSHKIRVVWQIAEHDEKGQPFLVTKRYTLSLHEKAALRKDLEAWRGRAFNEQELTGFDVETVIGIPCLLSVLQEKKPDGDIWANINALMRLPKSMPAPAPTNYVRVKDRKEDGIAQPEDYYIPTDDDIPF